MENLSFSGVPILKHIRVIELGNNVLKKLLKINLCTYLGLRYLGGFAAGLGCFFLALLVGLQASGNDPPPEK